MLMIVEEQDPEVNVKIKPGGFICRLEPNNTDWIMKFPRSAKLMKKAGWFKFYEKLQGYHSQVTMLLIKNYRDEKVQLEILIVRVNEDSTPNLQLLPSY